MASRVAVVGGGMLGLAVAHRLAQRGFRVTVFEAEPKLGGLASPWQLGDVSWDRHYHVILASDRALRDLLDELQLDNKIKWAATQTGFFIDNRLHPFTSPTHFLRFPALNIADKTRLLATILLSAARNDGQALEKIPVSAYLRRLSGATVLERFWLPLLRSKLGDSYREASASFIWATIRRLTAARRAGIQERFGYVAGGYRAILKALAGRLEQEGVEIRLQSPVTAVISQDARLRIATAGGAADTFDHVIVTTPSPIAVSQCGELSAQEKSKWLSISYQGIICASLLCKKALGPYYLTNICDPAIPFTGVVEMSALMGRDEFDGRSLIYLPKYVDPREIPLAGTDDEIRADFLRGLARIYPEFRETDVEAFRISRVRHVFAIPTLHYSANLPSMKTSVPNLWIVNSAQIVNGTLNVNEVVQLANRASENLAIERLAAA